MSGSRLPAADPPSSADLATRAWPEASEPTMTSLPSASPSPARTSQRIGTPRDPHRRHRFCYGMSHRAQDVPSWERPASIGASGHPERGENLLGPADHREASVPGPASLPATACRPTRDPREGSVLTRPARRAHPVRRPHGTHRVAYPAGIVQQEMRNVPSQHPAGPSVRGLIRDRRRSSKPGNDTSAHARAIHSSF